MKKLLKDANLRVAQEWLAHAESDLHYAKRGVNDPFILGVHVCFHAQQAAEKAIKALLLAYGKDFPFTHDIETLTHLLKRYRIPAPSSVIAAGLLTPYAVQMRYPGDMKKDCDKKEVYDSIAMAKRIFDGVKKAIAKKQREKGKSHD